MPNNPKPWRHGTQYGYTTGGCRCDLCRTAHRKTNKKNMADRSRAIRQLGFKPAWVNITSNSITMLVGYSKLVIHELAGTPPTTERLRLTDRFASVRPV